jgi:hypothetical protein
MSCEDILSNDQYSWVDVKQLISLPCEISGSYDGRYEHNSLLGYSAVLSS